MTSQQNNRRIAKNTAFLYVRMFFVLVVSLYAARVVLNTLGVEDYGVYNVVAGFVSMFGFLNATLSSSMQRFYNYEGTKDKESGYAKVYSTGLIIQVVLGIILFLILETVGVWYVNNVMVVPDNRLSAANIVYQTSVISMMFVVIQVPYTGALMADERMNFYAVVSILDALFKLLIVLVLPFSPYDKLIVYGICFMFISVFDFIAYFIYAKKKVLVFRVRFLFDRPLFKSMMSFSGWNLLGSFAFLLKGQGLNMLLNTFFGAAINAARGVAFNVNSAISGFSANISMAFRPQVVNSYADSNYKRCTDLMLFESKICYMLLLLLITPVALEIDYILHLWLGSAVPEHTNSFAVLVLIDSLICTLNTPVTQVAFATGRIKIYQILSSCVNILLLPVCYIFLKQGNSSESVFMISIVFSAVNQIFCLWALKIVFDYSVADYIRRVILPCCIATLIMPVIPYYVRNLMDSSFLRLTIVCSAAVLTFIPVVYFIVLSSNERNQLITVLKSRLFKA